MVPPRLTCRNRFSMVARMMMTRLDLTGLKCPLPVLKTRKALQTLKAGERLEVCCTDPLAVIDIPNLVRETGDRVESVDRTERGILFRIEKAAESAGSVRR